MNTAWSLRLRSALRAAGLHLALSLVVAMLAAALVWGIWYPAPFDELSGGRELFLLIVAVDVVCGPALTLVVFSPGKPRRELARDLVMIGVLQLAALLYGLWTVHEARPQFLVHEIDRFRVIAQPDYLGVDIASQLAALPPAIRPSFWAGPRVVGIRPSADAAERDRILFEALRGGRDYAQRPEFYVPYGDAYARTATQRARPVSRFLERFPAARPAVEAALKSRAVPVDQAVFLPVAHRQDWIALMSSTGAILGFVPGDGFAVP